MPKADSPTKSRPRRQRRQARPSSQQAEIDTASLKGNGEADQGIRVLIVDDHAVVRSGLRLLLDAAAGVEAVGEAGDADEGIRQARRLKPDVVLLDVTMPGQSGIDALPRLLEASPDSKVLVLSMEGDPSYLREAFSQGASGYVLKEAADNELVTALNQVHAGGQYVHPALGARLAKAEGDARVRADADPLSDRERDVLRKHRMLDGHRIPGASARRRLAARAHID